MVVFVIINSRCIGFFDKSTDRIEYRIPTYGKTAQYLHFRSCIGQIIFIEIMGCNNLSGSKGYASKRTMRSVDLGSI